MPPALPSRSPSPEPSRGFEDSSGSYSESDSHRESSAAASDSSRRSGRSGGQGLAQARQAALAMRAAAQSFTDNRTAARMAGRIPSDSMGRSESRFAPYNEFSDEEPLDTGTFPFDSRRTSSRPSSSHRALPQSGSNPDNLTLGTSGRRDLSPDPFTIASGSDRAGRNVQFALLPANTLPPASSSLPRVQTISTSSDGTSMSRGLRSRPVPAPPAPHQSASATSARAPPAEPSSGSRTPTLSRAKRDISGNIRSLEKAGPPKVPRFPRETPIPPPDYGRMNTPSESRAHPSPASQKDLDRIRPLPSAPSQDVSTPDTRMTVWERAITSRAPCEYCLRKFLKDHESGMPALQLPIPCIISDANTSRCDRCNVKHHSPCTMGDPLIVGSIADVHLARAILQGLARDANPAMSLRQQARLGASWARLATSIVTLSSNGPSGAPAFKKTVDNPKYEEGGSEKRYISVSNDSAIMEASIFRSQALANAYAFKLVDFSGEFGRAEALRANILRDLMNSRRGMPRVSPADQGFPSWHGAVQGFLEEIGSVVMEVYQDWPKGYVLLLQEMTHGMRTALPQQLFGENIQW